MRCTGRSELTGVSKGEGVTQVNVTLQPVYDDGKNSEWSKWTPSGQLQMTITNPAAYEQFKLGQAYFVDLTPAED
jgi:hypothetical protein